MLLVAQLSKALFNSKDTLPREGFPCGSAGKESICPAGDLGSIPGFDPWVGEIPWRREMLPTPVFWPEEFHGLYVVFMGSQRVGHDWAPFTFCLEKPQSRSDYQVQIQLLSPVSLFVTPWTAAHQANLSITNSQSLLKLISIESVIPSSNLIPCCPLLLPHSIFRSIRIFSNESVLCIRWSEYWSFSFSISPSSEYSGLISFRMDWLDLLTVRGTLKSLLQHYSSKASILWHSAFFLVQLSHPCMTTGKTIALTRWTFVGKVMSLHFNMLSRLAIGEGNGNPLQYSCLENPMDGGAW